MTPTTNDGSITSARDSDAGRDPGAGKINKQSLMHRRHTTALRSAAQWTCPPGRQLPPFGKSLADAFLRGLQPRRRQTCVWLDCWPPKQPSILSVVCPLDGDPERYDWRILAGLDVLVNVTHPCDGDRLSRLLVELVAVKPRRLIVLRPNPPHAEFIISAAHGLEVQP